MYINIYIYTYIPCRNIPAFRSRAVRVASAEALASLCQAWSRSRCAWHQRLGRVNTWVVGLVLLYYYIKIIVLQIMYVYIYIYMHISIICIYEYAHMYTEYVWKQRHLMVCGNLIFLTSKHSRSTEFANFMIRACRLRFR